MKLNEKIKKIRIEKGLSLKDLYNIMLNDFGENTVAYRTLLRIEAGETDSRGSTLHQISTALGMPLSELKKDTEEETGPADFVARNKRLGRYVFSEDAFSELLMRQNHNFMATELVLKAGSKTKLERDPELTQETPEAKQIKFEKYAYCLRGTVVCYIGNNKYILRKGDGLTFESSMPHWFENPSKSVSRCLIIQNPRYL